MSTTTDELDLGALRQAIERRDAEAVCAMFAPDAELISIDVEHPPSNPRRARGIEEIRNALTDVYARDMTHKVTQAIGGPGAASYAVACRYPDGTRVMSNAMLDVREGQIVRMQEVVAWD